jgi:hypothetical protein
MKGGSVFTTAICGSYGACISHSRNFPLLFDNLTERRGEQVVGAPAAAESDVINTAKWRTTQMRGGAFN